MVSFWGSKKDDNQDSAAHDSEQSDSPPVPRHSEADERTRLLPPPATVPPAGYLTPDDPAVCSSIFSIDLEPVN